jgi:uncharacterized protein
MTTEPYFFGGEEIAPGSLREFEIHAGRLPSGTQMTLPIKIAHGAKPGPVIWLSGAIHGDEIVGVAVIRHVLEALKPKKMAGTVLAVPVVNVFGFVTGSRYLPDRRDLNRSFPGSSRGSLAARLARLFVDTVVDRCDYGIDFHAGSDDRTNLPQIRGNMDDDETRRLALAFGPDVMLHSATIKGTLRETALRRSKTILLFEGGEPRRFSTAAVEAGTAGALRVLGALGMISDPPPPRETPPLEARSTTWVRAPRGGIFRLEIQLGALLTKGQRVGVIADPADAKYTTVRSPVAGVVLGHAVNPLVYPGAGLLHVAEVSKSKRTS